MLLKEVRAKKIFDSRKKPTIEVSANGQKASAPSGKSKGKAETPSYHKSIDWNINFLNKTKFNLEINSFKDLEKLEFFIKKKTKLRDVKQFGANALVALEIATLKALAKSQGKQLWQTINPNAKKIPVPVGNSVGGGLHSENFENHPTFQEFELIPNENSAKQNVKSMNKVYKQLKRLLKSRKKNDEGAWQTTFHNEQVLTILRNFETRIGLDIAATSFYKNKIYKYKNKKFTTKEQIDYINYIIKKYNLFYIEDPLHEDDFSGFSKIIRSSNHLVVGDDLTATQISRLKKAIKLKSINAIIIKPNQNGSLLELAKVFKLCKKHNIKTILSHRSGETLDNALADLAVGFQADFIKTGISTKWREAKLKRLIQIEKRLQ